jgi:hypothetical protein
MRPIHLLMPFVLVLAGCATPMAPVPDDAVITAQVAVADQDGRRVLADLEGWKATDIHHVNLTLTLEGETAAIATKVVPQASLASPITFGNLKRGRSYQVVATAYQAEAESESTRLDDPTGSVTTFPTGTTNTPVAIDGGVKLKLRVRVFAGSSTGAVTVTTGGRDNTTDPVTVTVNRP